jgi:Putative zinc-finger
MSSSCAQWRGDIGAYIVDALDGHARDQVARHLAGCAGCRAEYDELVPVRDWLGVLDLVAGAPQPGPARRPAPAAHNSSQEGTADALPLPSCRESGTRIRARLADPPPPGRPRTWRRLAVAGAGLAAAAVGVAVLISNGAAAQNYRAADNATGVSASAQLHDTSTGTQIDLTATGLPGHQRCILVAVTRAGADIAGSWDATYEGSARIAGTTAFPARQLTALRIESDTGTLLLTIRL